MTLLPFTRKEEFGVLILYSLYRKRGHRAQKFTLYSKRNASLRVGFDHVMDMSEVLNCCKV